MSLTTTSCQVVAQQARCAAGGSFGGSRGLAAGEVVAALREDDHAVDLGSVGK